MHKGGWRERGYPNVHIPPSFSLQRLLAAPAAAAAVTVAAAAIIASVSSIFEDAIYEAFLPVGVGNGSV